jgi:tRNA pseudouridine38-40 synthase
MLNRFFVELSYLGTHYHGWQRQPGKSSVQETIEKAFSMVLRSNIIIFGCGRTDTGVHASQYFFHFDFDKDLPHHFLSTINRLLPQDIAIKQIFRQEDSSRHARFDACKRTYEYNITFQKNPFLLLHTWKYGYAVKPDVQLMEKAARIISAYTAFAPFCKTGHSAKSMICHISESMWTFDREKELAVYKISANRFLRGMVRLIVGAQIQIGMNKLSLEELEYALENQSSLKQSLSIPAVGLTLTEVKYPWDDAKAN